MNSRSRFYLKEAVQSIQKGHLTLEDASHKYEIPAHELKEAIKNYCLHGSLPEASGVLSSGINKIMNILSIKGLFNKIAPTYDCEKEIDRFKFKFTYTAASFLLAAFGAAAFSFSAYLTPDNSSAKPTFEEKLDRTLIDSTKREKTVEKEIKYLNNFYSRINKILDESDSKDSKMLKDEVKKRLKYINNIDEVDIAQKSADSKDIHVKNDLSRSDEIYANLYEAACSVDKDNYMAKTLKERIDNKFLKENSKYGRARSFSGSAAAANARRAAEETKEASEAAELKPMIEEKQVFAEKRFNDRRADKNAAVKAAPAEAAIARVNKAPAAKVKQAEPDKTVEAVKTYKYNRTQSKKYDGLKDKLYIINKYKHESLIKKAVAKKDLKFKYPVSDLIFVPDRASYNESLKKIATNKDYNGQAVMITEDRG